MPALAPATRKKLLLRVGLALVVVAALGIFLLRGVHFQELAFKAVALVTQLGPWAFFTAMALLPAFANMALTYWLARFVFRKWLAQLLGKLGYKLPKVDRADMTDLIIILRTTTGIPACVQNYTLGLVDAPVGQYFLVSCLCAIPGNAAYIIFGEALLHGRGGTVLLAFSLIVALAAATQLLRRHYGNKKKRLAAA